MPTHWGTAGTVRVGAQAIAELDNWSFTSTRAPVEDTAMGDTWKTFIPGSGIREWSGQAECHWNEDDAGQNALIGLPSVTLNMYPEGATTGDIYWSGLVEITEDTLTVVKDGSTIRATFSFTGNGPLNRLTV